MKYAEFNADVQFLRFLPKIPFLSKYGPKHQNCQFKLKCVALTNSNVQKAVTMFTFSFFNRKYPIWVNLIQKIRIVSYLNDFECAKINDDVHFFCFRLEIPILGKFSPKNLNRQFNLKFCPYRLRARDGFIQPIFYKRFDCFSL